MSVAADSASVTVLPARHIESSHNRVPAGRTARGRIGWWVGAWLAIGITTSAQAVPITTDQVATPKPTASAIPEIEQAYEQFKQQRFEAALELLDAAVAKHPELPPGRTTLARFFLQNNQLPAARALIEQTVIELPDDPEAYRMLGDIAFQERRLTEAKLLFEHLQQMGDKFSGNATRKASYESAAHAGLAAVAEARQQWEVARDHLTAWLAKDPNNAGAHHRMGQTLFGLDKPDEAYRELQTAAAAVAELPPAELTMGRLYQQSGNAEQAAKWMDKAIEKSPDSLAARLGVAQWQWEVGRLDDAKQNAEAALKIKPDSLEGQVLAGLIHRYLKNFPVAEEHLQAAYLASPGNAMAANQLALVLAEQPDPGKRKRAQELAEGNSREFNNNPEIAATLGWIYLQQGRTEDAARILKAVAGSGRISADTAYFMAVLANKTGNTKEAITTLRAAIESHSPFAFRSDADKLLTQLESEAASDGAATATDAKPAAGSKAGATKPAAKTAGPATPAATSPAKPAKPATAVPAAGAKPPAKTGTGTRAPAGKPSGS